MRTGMLSLKPKDVSFHEAVDDPETRAEFIRRELVHVQNCVVSAADDLPDLQKLHALSNEFLQAIVASTKKMPYGMRCLARETLAELQVCSTSCPVVRPTKFHL